MALFMGKGERIRRIKTTEAGSLDLMAKKNAPEIVCVSSNNAVVDRDVKGKALP
jgi:hypothetical protein